MLTIMMVAMVSFCLSSCGSDDDDNYSNNWDEPPCWSCQGSGECYWCDGLGEKDCRCVQFSYKGNCAMCKGTGLWYRDTCPECSGSGLCQYCYGTLEETCEECNGSGICAECGGKSNSNGSSTSDNDNNGGSYNDNSGGTTKIKCATCGGSGRCDNVKMLYTTRKYYCLGSGRCQWCGGTGHIKGALGDWIRCNSCNGKLNNDYGDGKCGKCGGSGECKDCGGDGYR